MTLDKYQAPHWAESSDREGCSRVGMLYVKNELVAMYSQAQGVGKPVVASLVSPGESGGLILTGVEGDQGPFREIVEAKAALAMLACPNRYVEG